MNGNVIAVDHFGQAEYHQLLQHHLELKKHSLWISGIMITSLLVFFQDMYGNPSPNFDYVGYFLYAASIMHSALFLYTMVVGYQIHATIRYLSETPECKDYWEFYNNKEKYGIGADMSLQRKMANFVVLVIPAVLEFGFGSYLLLNTHQFISTCTFVIIFTIFIVAYNIESSKRKDDENWRNANP